MVVTEGKAVVPDSAGLPITIGAKDDATDDGRPAEVNTPITDSLSCVEPVTVDCCEVVAVGSDPVNVDDGLISMDDSCATISDDNVIVNTRIDPDVLGEGLWVDCTNPGRSATDEGELLPEREAIEVATTDSEVEGEVALTGEMRVLPVNDGVELTALCGTLSALMISAACRGYQMWSQKNV